MVGSLAVRTAFARRGLVVPQLRQARLASNGTSSPIVYAQAGVQKKVLKEGSGPQPQPGQQVTVHYTVLARPRCKTHVVSIQAERTLTNGSKFDSSRDRNQPFVFTIGRGQVIKGWDEGVMMMKVGERAELTCSPDYAYGARGFPPVIPPNSTLIFDVELLGLN